MRFLADFVMRGRFQATAMVGFLGILSWLLPPVSLVSLALLGLVTLRQGGRAGAEVAILATLGLALVALTGDLWKPALGVVLLGWLPIWLLGLWLRTGGSLGLAVHGTLLMTVGLWLGFLIWTGGETTWLAEQLEPLRQALVTSERLGEEDSRWVVGQMLLWLPGMMAGAFFLQLTLSLFLARSLQALLYNPGGFQEEFVNLRATPWMSGVYLPLALLSLGLGADAPDWVRALWLLTVPLFLMAGLAMLHYLVSRARLHAAWLVVIYGLLMTVPLPTLMIVSGVGLADSWVNFRGRIDAKRPS